MTATIVNLKNEDYDVFIGRGSKWGNPFIIGRDGTRDEVIRKYETYLYKHPKLLQSLDELQGKRLGCYCKPLACHGDVLIGAMVLERRRKIMPDYDKRLEEWLS